MELNRKKPPKTNYIASTVSNVLILQIQNPSRKIQYYLYFKQNYDKFQNFSESLAKG